MHPRLSLFLLTVLLLIVPGLPAQAAGLKDVVNALERPFQAATPAGERIEDYSADFFQESRIASLDRLQRARGRVSVRFDYRRSGEVPTVMFNWEYREPTTQEIVSNGKMLWVYLPENNQVIQSDIEQVSRAGANDPMTFLTGLGNLSRDFQISYASPNRDTDGNYVLDLRPRRSSALLNRMVIVVDRAAVEGTNAAPGVKDEFGNIGLSAKDQATVDKLQSVRDRGAVRPGARPVGPEPTGGLIFPILSTTVYDPSGNTTLIEFDDVRLNRGLSPSQFNFILPGGVEVIRPIGKGMGF